MWMWTVVALVRGRRPVIRAAERITGRLSLAEQPPSRRSPKIPAVSLATLAERDIIRSG